MSTPFLAEIRIFSFSFAPRGWGQCNGQLLPINQNQALFSLLGTTYGGNGVTNFALPNFQSCVPMHPGVRNGGTSHTLGERSGTENHALTLPQIPTHSHGLNVSSATASAVVPTGNALGVSAANLYAAPGSLAPMAADALANAGGSQAHSNMQPFLTLNFCIALTGIFPSRN